MTAKEELALIIEANGGVLRPVDVVEFARDPQTALHRRFTWDDTKAAQEWRLQEARQLIRVLVIVPESVNVPVRAFVSLNADRQQPGGGYRRLDDVMANTESRRLFLQQAMAEAIRWRDKYHVLEELGPVFVALDEVKQQALPAKQSSNVLAALAA